MPDDVAKSQTDAFLTLARERFKTCADADAEPREKQLHDYKFSAGGAYQWSDGDRELRAGRPMITNNRSDIYIKQITNQQRQLVGGIQIKPVDSGADPDTAETLEGVIRHIEVISDADVAYSTAGDHQVRMGVGFLRVLPEYIDEHGFDQELKIKRLRNRFSVYCDPAAQEPDASDARFMFIVEDVESDPDGTGEYQQRYHGTDAASLSDFGSIGNQAATWFPKGKVRIAEYFYEKRTKTELVQTSDGNTYTSETLPKELGAGVTIANRRGVEARTICWATINGVEVLEGNEDKTAGRELPIPYIPVVRVIGDEFDFGDAVDYRGVMRNALDAQKLANYMDSATAEMIALAPKAPFIAEFDQISEFKDQWENANRKNYAVLSYKSVAAAGHLVPPPTRNFGEPPIQAMAVVAQRAENNLRALLGYVDVGEQERRPEQSGKAILARQKQGEISNNHYLDNLRRAKRQIGRILIAWIPHIYDAQRVMRITGRDEREREVMVYAGAENAPQGPPGQLPGGVEKMYDLSIGRYDVVVSEGPSNQTRRQEASEAMTSVIQAAPQLLEVMGDLFFANLDWPEARQISERLKKALPPQFREEQEGQPQIPPEIQAEMQKQKQVIEQLMTEKEAETQKLQSEETRKAAELASKEKTAALEAKTEVYLAQIRLQAERDIAMLKIAAERDMATLKLQMAGRQHDADLQIARQMSETERHEREMAMMQSGGAT